VLIGELDEDVSVDPDPAEVADWSWTSIDDIRADAAKQPEKYAPWFLTALAIALDS
jgi:isopentenyldiphosphate isomerase